MGRVDPKPPQRVRDQALLRSLHIEWRECVLCHTPWPLSLHHIHKHPRDDLRANLVMLCGSGTTGCHGRIEAEDEVARRLLGEYLLAERDDFLFYLGKKLGLGQAAAWLERRLLVTT